MKKETYHKIAYSVGFSIDVAGLFTFLYGAGQDPTDYVAMLGGAVGIFFGEAIRQNFGIPIEEIYSKQKNQGEEKSSQPSQLEERVGEAVTYKRPVKNSTAPPQEYEHFARRFTRLE